MPSIFINPPYEKNDIGILTLDLDYVDPKLMLALRNVLLQHEDMQHKYNKWHPESNIANKEINDAIELLDYTIRLSGEEGGGNSERWWPEES